MTLHISLRQGEKIVVNGAVLSATRRADLVVENNVTILRGREVMTPQEATSPARRLYFACMMAYIDNDGREQQHSRIVSLLGDIVGVLKSEAAGSVCASFARHVAMADYYRALSDCRDLIAQETAILARLDAEPA